MVYDVIIIGAGCAGLTAAVYAARAGKTVLIIEHETIGGQISSSPRVENFPSIKQISGMEFSDNLFEQAMACGAEFELEKVQKIIDGDIKTVVTGTFEKQAKNIIVATGVKHRKLEIERAMDFEGKGISYCAVCDGGFFKDGNVAVLGGGDTALVNAIYLTNICKKVYIIHRRDEFRGEPVKISQLQSKDNAEILYSSKIVGLSGEDTLSGITVEDIKTGEKKELEVSGLFVSIGNIPDNDMVKGLLDLDEYGYIIAGEDCKTNIEGIFAAGDCRTKTVRQLTTAAADGAVAALSLK